MQYDDDKKTLATNSVMNRILELERTKEKTKDKHKLSRLEELIRINKHFLMIIDQGEENFRLEN